MARRDLAFCGFIPIDLQFKKIFGSGQGQNGRIWRQVKGAMGSIPAASTRISLSETWGHHTSFSFQLTCRPAQV